MRARHAVRGFRDRLERVLNQEDAIVILVDRTGTTTYSHGFGASGCLLELASRQVDGVLREIVGQHAVGRDAAPDPPLALGLSHVAFEVAHRPALLRMHRTLVNAGLKVGAVDLGVSWSLYLPDPDGHEVEIYCDTRRVPGGRGSRERFSDIAVRWLRLDVYQCDDALCFLSDRKGVLQHAQLARIGVQGAHDLAKRSGLRIGP